MTIVFSYFLFIHHSSSISLSFSDNTFNFTVKF